ncbi:SWIM zinc finger family protein [Paenibacillus athensensis]|uniref:Metal-binding protein n=1 Tax=Paenibacillus athensensis TaxID=1967502 RepID=A0A4Y8Q8Y9_9BACL|nr:SWIM zinc finger family protein [Paenibacillus athensensis]MCD1260034.1 SWIM zinc finger family protein [Paenibacillus athensensis]
MLKLQLPKNRMNYLIKQIQLHYEAEVLEQGWEYYHKSRVVDVELVGTTIQALVQGTNKAYEAVLHLEDFSYSECSCTYDGFCKHIAAAFFSLYAPYGRPELLLQELKQAIRSRRKPLRPASAPAERKAAAPTTPQEAGPPAEWHRFFETKFHGFSISHQHSIDTFYDSAMETLPGYAEGWRPAARELYRLHIVLFVMRKIEQFYRDTKSSYLSYYHETGCKTVARQCEEQLTLAVRKLEPETVGAAAALWRATLAMLGELALSGSDSPIDWLLAYRSVWWRVPQRELQQEEMRRLEQRLALPESAMRRRERDTLRIARAHFDVIAGRSAEAFARLDGLEGANAADFFLYLQHYEHAGQWSDMLVWLRWLLPAVEKANHEDFRTFCQYWMDTAKQLDSDAEWVRVMESLLPRSYYYYTAYLLQTRRYRQWVDLQLANRISPLSLYALELRAIEEHDPALLLPLYHQAAERAILEKNRASYKTAIRLLKKLHSFYRQLGQEPRWELYVNRLADKFSRLRAFQEELKKGKWIR